MCLPDALGELVHVSVGDLGLTFLHDDVGPTHPASVCRDLYAPVAVVREDRHELVDVAGPPHLTERSH